jgi:hypothetical protein
MDNGGAGGSYSNMQRAALLPALALGFGFLTTEAHAQKGTFEEARVKAASTAIKFAQREFPSFKISDSAITERTRCRMVGSFWIVEVAGNRVNPGTTTFREKRIDAKTNFLEATVQIDSSGIVSIPRWSATGSGTMVARTPR